MRRTPEAVKVIQGALALGFSLSEALQRVLGCSLSAFGAENGFSPSEVSMCVRFYEGRVYPEIREKLAERLATSRETIDELIESAAAGRIPA